MQPAMWETLKAVQNFAPQNKDAILLILQGGGQIDKKPTMWLRLKEPILVVLLTS